MAESVSAGAGAKLLPIDAEGNLPAVGWEMPQRNDINYVGSLRGRDGPDTVRRQRG